MTGVPTFEADVAIVGAGPAGSSLAARLAQLGHRVVILDRARVASRRLGESLSPGVAPLLSVTGADRLLPTAAPLRVREMEIEWGSRLQRVESTGGLLVDRRSFDRALLAHARTLGAKVAAPATLRRQRYEGEAWRLQLDAPRGAVELRASLLVDASGRSSALRPRRTPTGASTLALFGYFTGRTLPNIPSIRARHEEWIWGMPLPDGSYNALVFVARDRLKRLAKEPLSWFYRRTIERSGLLANSPDAIWPSAVLAADATPYLEQEPVTPTTLRVGDAALALDPISSSGVQKALQSALAAAVVVNTLLRRPSSAGAAVDFYRSSLQRSSVQHGRWAAGHYAEVAAVHPSCFWAERAGDAQPASAEGSGWVSAESTSRLELCSRTQLLDVPCIDGDFVVVKEAVCHPKLEEPVAFLGGSEIAPLLRELRAPLTRPVIEQLWARRLPLGSARAIAEWLTVRGVLVPAP